MPFLREIVTGSTWGNGSLGKESTLVYLTLSPKPSTLNASLGKESKRELAHLWDPTFSMMERFTLFWKSPIVINFFNILVSWTVTIIFSQYFIEHSPVLQDLDHTQEPIDWQEFLILGYCKKRV